MAFICSRISRYEVLFITVFMLFTNVLCYTPFGVREIGSSYNFTCPLTNQNGTYKFSKLSFTTGKKLLKPGGNIQQYGNILEITNLGWDDAGQYFCSIFDSNGKLLEDRAITILTIVPVKKYYFKILPDVQTSIIDDGMRFKLRCEYEKPSTELKWERRRFINGTSKTDYLPRSVITLVKDAKQSVEEYIINKVTADDIGSYRCGVRENGNMRYTNVRVLQVKGKKPPVFHETKPVFVSKEENDISIQFSVQGAPSPDISCYLNTRLAIFCSGKTIEDTDIHVENGTYRPAIACSKDNYDMTGYHKLIIRSALFPQNDGLYKCVATNDVGNASIQFRVNVTTAPKIDNPIGKIYQKRENEEGSITCIIKKSKPRPAVTWYQQDYPDIEENPKADQWTISQNQPELVQSLQQRGMYKSTLRISKDEGQSFYRCFAKNAYGNDSRIFKFIRYGIGQEPFVVVPKSKVLNEGEVFIAMCRVTKLIKGDILFYKVDTQTVMMNDNRTNITITQGSNFRNMTMVIRNLTVNDSGTYQCVQKDFATNDVTVTLTVKALRPPVILQFENQTVLENKEEDSEVVLFCDVKGNPFPKITWIRNGKKTVVNPLVIQSCSTQVPGFYYKNKEKTKLAICKPRMRHTGVYTCSIMSHLGNDSRDVYVDVTAKPKIVKPETPVRKRLFAGKAFQRVCEAEGNPVPMVQWILRNKNRVMTNISEGVSILKVNEMDESYIGNYTCKAFNSYGMVEKFLVELELRPPEIIPTPALAEGEMTTGTIIGIVIGIVFLVFLLFVFAILWYRRQQKKLLFYKHQYFLRTGEYAVDPSITLNEQSMNLPYDPDWEFPYERLVFGERLGAGAFGEVYKAEAMGILALNPRDKSGVASKRRSKIRRTLRASQRPKKKTIPPNLTNAIVAVKTVKAQATESEIRDLAAELKLMIHIGEHKNIVNLLGACTTGRKLYVILEFCPYGNLLTFLRSKRDIYNSTWIKETYDPEKEFTLIDIVGAAFQVAKGMEFLASRKLIHRDLAARNILVAHEYVMKISDFGLARDIYQSDVYVKTSSGMLPVKWMAVESLFDRVYTHQSDVWSFGVLLWEMMTLGGTPYPNLPAEQLLDFLNEGKRMPQPNKCPLEVYTIMRDCWQEQPEERPTFSVLVEHLGRILERHLEKANPYLLVEASPEEIEAAKEKDELLNKPKSNYYLQPLLMSQKLHSYDSNAPLPTPPTSTYSGAITAPLPEVDTKPASSKIINRAGSYELLRDDSTLEQNVPEKQKVPVETENGVNLESLDSKNNKNGVHEEPKHVESVV